MFSLDKTWNHLKYIDSFIWTSISSSQYIQSFTWTSICSRQYIQSFIWTSISSCLLLLFPSPPPQLTLPLLLTAFPQVEVYLECNIEMCKRHCTDLCSGLKSKRSKRQELNDSSTDVFAKSPSRIIEPARVTRGIRVVAPEDMDPMDQQDWNHAGTGRVSTGDVCMSLPGFVTSLSAILAVLLGSCVMSVVLFLRVRQLALSNDFMSPPASKLAASTESLTVADITSKGRRYLR